MLTRGHQHIPELSSTPGIKNPLFGEVCQTGHATSWQHSAQGKLRPNSVWNGETVTLWSSPGHTPWNHFQNTHQCDKQSAVILQLSNDFINWQLRPLNIQVS